MAERNEQAQQNSRAATHFNSPESLYFSREPSPLPLGVEQPLLLEFDSGGLFSRSEGFFSSDGVLSDPEQFFVGRVDTFTDGPLILIQASPWIIWMQVEKCSDCLSLLESRWSELIASANSEPSCLNPTFRNASRLLVNLKTRSGRFISHFSSSCSES
jgi:hypothetical protein